MSFWLPIDSILNPGDQGGGESGRAWHENDFCEIVRDVAGDLVETVILVGLPGFLGNGLLSWAIRLTISDIQSQDGRVNAID